MTRVPPTDTPSPSPTGIPSRTDGRRERGERNKEAVVTALLALYDGGEIEPSAARIAEIAGVSERSVFRYFLDKDDLAATAMNVQMERVRHLYDGLSVDGGFDERLDAILDHRRRLFDAVRGMVNASAVLEHRSEIVRQAVEQRRAFLRAQAIDQFRPELSTVNDQRTAARALDIALSLETLSTLSAQCSRATTRTTVSFMVRAALSRR